MAAVNRPLSPHLQIYKPQLTSVLSITHRGTGVFLSLGALFLSCWLLSIANGPESYTAVQQHVLSWYGQTILYAWVFSLYYHLCNGIRHLCWDMGFGFEIKTTYISGYIVLAVSILFTIATWCLVRGGV
jgi:succinate dehydrogenase / fumarate reductase cytochrome b subunit